MASFPKAEFSRIEEGIIIGLGLLMVPCGTDKASN